MINKLSEEAYANAVSKGFYDDPEATNMGTRIALIHSEVSEMLEADRNKNYCILDGEKVYKFATDLDISDEDFKAEFKSNIKDTLEDEMADAIIRLMDLAGFKGIDLEAHIKAKMKYNSLRPHKHGKSY